jgi:AcrR family transcriptional regulator
VQDAVLDAAEALLQETGDLSMRALADRAGVSFTTPFKHFGNKSGILRGLALRLMNSIVREFEANEAPVGLAARVHSMNRAGFAVMMRQPVTSRAVISALSDPHPEGPNMREEASRLWAVALGDLEGVPSSLRPLARRLLPDQLAIVFRGAIALWVAGELADRDVVKTADIGVDLILCAFLSRNDQAAALSRLAEKYLS